MGRGITNTTTPDEIHATALLGMMVGTGAIEAQEARGTLEISTQRESLPTKGSDSPAWAKMGVVFGERLPDDPMFRAVMLPEGWKIVRTDHSMWTNLVDDKGRERASIFYKAAFYDREAFAHPMPRYTVHDSAYEMGMDGRTSPACGIVRDGKVEIFRSAPFAPFLPTKATEWKTHHGAALSAAVAWLAEHRPQWRDPAAYWDLP